MENVSIIEELDANRQSVQMKFRQILIGRYTCSISMALFCETVKIIQLFFLGLTPSLPERIISLLLILLNKKWYMHDAFIYMCVCMCVANKNWCYIFHSHKLSIDEEFVLYHLTVFCTLKHCLRKVKVQKLYRSHYRNFLV